ncbi:hypothetical protein SFRURICE_014004, partial [Spodoptera frugiperda]
GELIQCLLPPWPKRDRVRSPGNPLGNPQLQVGISPTICSGLIALQTARCTHWSDSGRAASYSYLPSTDPHKIGTMIQPFFETRKSSNDFSHLARVDRECQTLTDSKSPRSYLCFSSRSPGKPAR